MPVEELEDTYEQLYEDDVFDAIDDDLPVKKRRVRARKPSKSSISKVKHVKKEKKVSKTVEEMQQRYNALIDNPNTTKQDWQKFYVSIEKFIMTQAYKVNFNHYIEKNSDLWGYLIHIILESIIPKKDVFGNVSCWYIDPIKLKVRKGYDRTQTNLGNYLLNKIKWSVIAFNQQDFTFVSYCTDLDLDPIPDSSNRIEDMLEGNFEDEEIDLPAFPYMLEIRGHSDDYVKELSTLCKLRNT